MCRQEITPCFLAAQLFRFDCRQAAERVCALFNDKMNHHLPADFGIIITVFNSSHNWGSLQVVWVLHIHIELRVKPFHHSAPVAEVAGASQIDEWRLPERTIIKVVVIKPLTVGKVFCVNSMQHIFACIALRSCFWRPLAIRARLAISSGVDVAVCARCTYIA